MTPHGWRIRAARRPSAELRLPKSSPMCVYILVASTTNILKTTPFAYGEDSTPVSLDSSCAEQPYPSPEQGPSCTAQAASTASVPSTCGVRPLTPHCAKAFPASLPLRHPSNGWGRVTGTWSMYNQQLIPHLWNNFVKLTNQPPAPSKKIRKETQTATTTPHPPKWIPVYFHLCLNYKKNKSILKVVKTLTL